jgi:hypothetical protein
MERLNKTIAALLDEFGGLETWKKLSKKIEGILDGTSRLGKGEISSVKINKTASVLTLVVKIHIP